MKRPARPRTLLLVAAAAAMALLPTGVAAEDPGDPNDHGTVQIGPLNKGPVVSQGSGGYDPNGITAAASTKPSGSGTTSTEPTYTYSPVPYNSIPGACPTQNNGLIINPRAGLTGLPSWFWLSGSAAMPDAVATSGPLTVRVRARLAGASWEFGDGLGFDSVDLGQPYPAQSGVQHLYQTDTYRLPNGYRVIAILRYLVTYSVNGGSWNTLGVKTRPFSQQYLVYQLQPEAVAGQ